MGKTYVGSRLRQLRRDYDLSQASLAATLGLSASYVNQIEHDVRPLTDPVLDRITSTFDVDATFFSRDDNSRLLAEVQDAMLDKDLYPTPVDVRELAELVDNHPAIARAVVAMHQRYRNTRTALALADAHPAPHSPATQHLTPMPHEEVQAFFYTHRNYLHDLDTVAETLATQLDITPDTIRATEDAITQRLQSHHGVRILHSTDATGFLHRYNPDTRELTLAARLTPGQQAFRMATVLGFLEAHDHIQSYIDQAQFTSPESTALAMRGLASYYAAALILPYRRFHAAAEDSRYDIEYLSRVFGVGYETICHRLSTLQRPDLRGVPFTFVRVDRAGNISKRQSATGFHFTHIGGTCPLWNVYDTFTTPGRIMRQLAHMPDGRTYLWIARTVSHHGERYGEPGKLFAIGLGCEARHARRTIYADGLDWNNLHTATPIGASCYVCTREDCAQRAYPPIHRPLLIDAHESTVAPY